MPALSLSSRAGPRGGAASKKADKKLKKPAVDLTAVELEIEPQGSPVDTTVVEKKGVGIIQPVCMICHYPCLGYYGRWGGSGTCSKACEQKAKEEEAEKQQDQAEA